METTLATAETLFERSYLLVSILFPACCIPTYTTIFHVSRIYYYSYNVSTISTLAKLTAKSRYIYIFFFNFERKSPIFRTCPKRERRERNDYIRQLNRDSSPLPSDRFNFSRGSRDIPCWFYARYLGSACSKIAFIRAIRSHRWVH